jgi:micrococcal nuclease
MRHTLPILLLSALISCLSLAAQERIPVQVISVSDGDTFWAEDAQGQKIKFRPIGFDCPEEANFGRPAEPYNEEATAYTTSLIMDQKIYVQYDIEQADKWGRHLVYVWLEDGRLFNEEILRAGWAVVATYPPNVAHVERFTTAQREAREQGRGMWAQHH